MEIPFNTLLSAAEADMTVREMLERAMNGSIRVVDRQANGITAVVNGQHAQAVERDTTEQPHERMPQRRARRDGTANRKVYVVLRADKGKNKGQPANEPSDLPASYMRVWEYLKKHERNGKGIESRAITAAIGCPQKTTESALYWLRQAKAVESR